MLSSDSTSQEELLWVVARSLLSAQAASNDVILQASLRQYEGSSGERTTPDEGALADIEHRLEHAAEDIELAKAAVRELQTEEERHEPAQPNEQ